MKHNRLFITLTGIAIATGIGYRWYTSHAASQPEATPGASNVSALIVTQKVQQRSLAQTLDAFGEVATGKPDSLSFPQAGQVIALAVVTGQQVRRGDLLARLASDPNAVSAYVQADNAVGFARREMDRQQQLLGLQLATRSQVDAARKQLEDAQAALSAQAQLGGTRVGAELRAPYEGVVTATSVAQGDRIAAGATVVQLGRTGRLRVLLGLEPAQSALVRPGTGVTINSVITGTKPFQATIGEVAAIVDPKSQMVTAVVDLPASEHPGLVAGTRVQAAIRVADHNAWEVPRLAVLTDERGDYVFQVRASKAHRVDVRKVAETGQTYGVEGLIDGQLPVVVQGNYELGEGMTVREGTK